jgi:hypothetical protein
MAWTRVLAYVTGTVDQELLARNEYLAAENRILKSQLNGRLKLSDAERAMLGKIGHRNEGSAAPTSHAAPHADLAARSAARPPLFVCADAPGGPAPCWRAILRTLVKKLLAAAPPRASERMRPGRGRKRSSLSRLIGAARADRPENAENPAVVPLKVPRMLAFRQDAAL